MGISGSTKEEIGELIKALCKAKKEFKPIIKDGKNSFLTTKYVTLDAIVNATEDALNENGLVIIHHQELRNGDKFLVTELIHESGQIKPTETSMNEYIGSVQLNEKGNVKVNPLQIFGSVLTYLKRYHIGQLLNVAVDEDSDGNNADTGKKQQPKSAIEILHAKYFGLLGSKKLNEQQRHDWQVENIGKASINDWLIADYQKAIDILESKEKPADNLDALFQKAKEQIDANNSLKALDVWATKNIKNITNSPNKDRIESYIKLKGSQLSISLIVEKTELELGNVQDWYDNVDHSQDKSLDALLGGDDDAIAQVKAQIIDYMKSLEAPPEEVESVDGGAEQADLI